MSPTPARRHRPDDRGMVLPLVAVVLSTLLLFTSMAIDLGHERVVRRDLQALADIAALDLSRRLDGRTAGSLAPDMDAALAEVLLNNGVTAAPDGLAWQLGSLGAGRTFVPASPGDVPTAVRVELQDGVEWLFRPGQGTASRSAVAGRRTSACASAGSVSAGAIGITTGADAVLDRLVALALAEGADGPWSPTTSMPPFHVLAGFRVRLDLLAAELGASGPAALAAGRIDIEDLFDALGDALRLDGHLTVGAWLDQIGHSLDEDVELDLRDALSVDADDELALDQSVPVLDVVAAAAFAVAEGAPLPLAGAVTSLPPGLTLGRADVRVVGAAVPTCGPPGRALPAFRVQVDVELAGTVDLGLAGVGPIDVAGAIGADTAEPTAATTRLRCPTQGEAAELDVATRTPPPVADLVFESAVGGLDVVAEAVEPGTGSPTDALVGFAFPPDGPGTSRWSGTGGLPSTGLFTFAATGTPPAPYTEAEVLAAYDAAVVQPAMDALVGEVFGPLATLIGRSADGVRVTALDLECAGPGLLG